MLEASGALSYDQVYLDALSSTGKVSSCCPAPTTTSSLTRGLF